MTETNGSPITKEDCQFLLAYLLRIQKDSPDHRLHRDFIDRNNLLKLFDDAQTRKSDRGGLSSLKSRETVVSDQSVSLAEAAQVLGVNGANGMLEEKYADDQVSDRFPHACELIKKYLCRVGKLFRQLFQP